MIFAFIIHMQNLGGQTKSIMVFFEVAYWVGSFVAQIAQRINRKDDYSRL